MTVFRPKGRTTFRYDFWWKGERYTGTTDQTTQREAEIVEADVKKQLRLRAHGLAPEPETLAPTFDEWADIYFHHVVKHRKDITRPERIEGLLRVVLRFWGSRPDETRDDPYHDLRLDAPIRDPQWLLKFEDWMDATRQPETKRPLSGQTRNQYRSVLNQMYALALQPAFRKASGVTVNPFVGVTRNIGVERTSTVTVEQLRAWIAHASYHVRLAVSIAALAPKLRLANVLALRWRDVDLARRLIVVYQHKTAGATKKPLVVPIVDQLHAILTDAKARGSRTHVITFRQRPVKGIRDGVRAAAIDAGIPWGRFGEDTATFHTIRHTMATLLAELGELDGLVPLDPSVRKKAMGHKRLETTERYTHIRPTIETRALERLSAQVPIVDLVTAARRRAERSTSARRAEEAKRQRGGGKSGGTRDPQRGKIPAKSTNRAEALPRKKSRARP